LIAVGFNFQKGKIRLAALRKDQLKIHLVARKQTLIDSNLDLPELADRYLTSFRGFLDEYKPELIATRIVYDIKTIAALAAQGIPVGLLAFAAREKNLPFRSYTPQGLRSGTAFGFAKDQKPIDLVDEKFGTHPPHWDEMQKTAVLAAWRALLDAET
jgi:Holliday junction resolvasome RuvABC endonuclease subunit